MSACTLLGPFHLCLQMSFVFGLSISRATTNNSGVACLLTPRSRVLLEKLTGLQPVRKFPAFHGTRTFFTTLTGIRHLSLSWASPIQSQIHCWELKFFTGDYFLGGWGEDVRGRNTNKQVGCVSNCREVGSMFLIRCRKKNPFPQVVS